MIIKKSNIDHIFLDLGADDRNSAHAVVDTDAGKVFGIFSSDIFCLCSLWNCASSPYVFSKAGKSILIHDRFGSWQKCNADLMDTVMCLNNVKQNKEILPPS
jgi:hypothetical protein